MVPDAVEHHVVPFLALCEILSGVVDDMIRTKGLNQLRVARAAHTSDVSAEGLGNLHGECPHTSCRPIDQDLVVRLNPTSVAQALQSPESRDRNCSGLDERHPFGLRTTIDSRAHAYSAKAPCVVQTPTADAPGSRIQMPNTSSPGSNCFTFLPVASTRPATSKQSA